MRAAVLIFLTLHVQPGHGDYPCLCNYAVDTPIYRDHDTGSAVINHLYEFDCTPTYQSTVNNIPKWQSVVKDHQVGFVKLGSFLMQQQCQGDPDPVDTVTGTTGVSSPSTTTAPPSSTIASSSAVRRSTATVVSPVMSTLSSVLSTLATHRVTYTQTTVGSSSSRAISQTPKLFSATPMAKQTTLMPAHKLTQTPPSLLPSSLSTTTTAAVTTKPTTTTSTTTTTTTTTTGRPVTHKPATTPQTHHFMGIHFCPSVVMAAARHNGGFAKVHGNSCYELVPTRATWQNAELNCRHKGGHLVHISNADDEKFLMQLLKDHDYKQAVWTGLNDIDNEEHFSWSSGDRFVYSKWTPGRKNNFMHNYEDCVALVPYLHAGFLQTNGQWDDVNCQHMYPWICEYDFYSPQGTTLPPVVNFFMNIFGK